MEEQGLIVKATGGFYYVQTSSRIVECRARGSFRKDSLTPYVGDRVVISHTDNEKGYVTKILPRDNFLIRPPVANITRLVMIVSIKEPSPNLEVLDKLLAIAQYRDIEPVIVITKTDMADGKPLAELYRKAGFNSYTVSSQTGEGVKEVAEMLSSGISVFCGNTGAGKSSLLNAIDPELNLQTAMISKKLGRGKHTTRHVELFPMAQGGYIADTPGFSSIEVEKFDIILKDQLQYCFREFEDYIPQCQFTGCSHTKEKGCAVLEAVGNGDIATSRHKNYLTMYEDAKGIKEWEKNKRGQ